MMSESDLYLCHQGSGVQNSEHSHAETEFSCRYCKCSTRDHSQRKKRDQRLTSARKNASINHRIGTRESFSPTSFFENPTIFGQWKDRQFRISRDFQSFSLIFRSQDLRAAGGQIVDHHGVRSPMRTLSAGATRVPVRAPATRAWARAISTAAATFWIFFNNFISLKFLHRSNPAVAICLATVPLASSTVILSPQSRSPFISWIASSASRTSSNSTKPVKRL